MESNIILTIMKYIIAVAGIVVAFVWYLVARKFRHSEYIVVFWLVFVVGLYWSLYYSWSIIRTILDIPFLGHQIWVRAPILLTLGILIGLGIARLKEIRI